MPNDITNEVTFSNCSSARFRDILSEIQNDEEDFGSIDFNKIVPQPEGLFQGPIGPREREIYKDNNWYDWNIAHWGTKWNAYSSRCDISTKTLIFTTANSSAYPVVKALSERYPDVYFKYRFADEDFGYNVAEFELSASECVRLNQPTGGSLEAQKLAADILGIELKYDIERNYGFAPSLHGDYYEYCEGAYVSPSFQCDQSLGHPAVLCYDKDEGKVWLEMYPLLDEEDDMYKDIENSIKAWGVHSCRSFDDFNGYLKSLGEDAYQSAYYEETEGMSLC